ncbi:MAG: hypothetical protein GC156_13645 [Actinomycetales bacterium]|nr:hypothetical protein [Actinomycetales bacterium]
MSTRQRIALEAAISAVLAFGLSLIVLGPLLGRLNVGWAGGDMLSTYVNTHAWSGFGYATTTQFGFPLGMNLNYFPGIDITENTFAWLVNSVAGTEFLGLNLLVLLTFPLVGALAYLVIRMTGLQGPIAIAFAVAFALIPFHWGRALGHTYLSTLYSAVVGIALVLLIGSGTLEHWWRTTTGARRWGRIAVLAVMVVTIAWTGVYYVAFTLLLGLAALVWRFARRTSWRFLGLDAVPLIGVGITAIVGFVPSLLSLRGDAPLASLGDRTPFESVTYAGTLASALLPMPDSHLPRGGYYNEAVQKVLNEAPYGESYVLTNFGTWVTSLALLAFVVALLVRARRGLPGSTTNGVSLGLIGYLIGVTVLLFVPWGLNVIFADLVTPQIRAWNRLVPVLLLLFLVAGAVALRGTRLSRSWAVSVPIAVVLLGLTAIDSVYPFKLAYANSVAEAGEVTDAARAYAADVNAAIPDDCGVLQLPYMAYPEHGVERGINDYDHFWTSLTNPGKSWSYGAVKNTDAGVWSAQLPQVPTAEQVSLLRGAGFCAIHLDTRGYISEVLQPVQAELAQRFGPPVASGYNGAWELYDIRSAEPAPSRDVAAFLHQPFISVDLTQVTPRETFLGDSWWWTRQPSAALTLTPTTPDAPLTGVRGAVAAPDCGALPITVTLSAGAQSSTTTVLAAPGEPASFDLSLGQPSAGQGTLVIDVPGEGCPVPGGSEKRFAQVLDVQPR